MGGVGNGQAGKPNHNIVFGEAAAHAVGVDSAFREPEAAAKFSITADAVTAFSGVQI